MMYASAVSFSSTTSWAMMIGSMLRAACGNSIRNRVGSGVETDGESGLALPARQGRDPGPQRLADERPVVDGERPDAGPERAGREHQQDEQHHQQHGHAAEELEHDRGGGRARRRPSSPQERKSTPITIANTAASAAMLQVVPSALSRSPPDERVVEDVPAVGAEDVPDAQARSAITADERAEHSDGDDGRDDHRDRARAFGPGAS